MYILFYKFIKKTTHNTDVHAEKIVVTPSCVQIF